MKKNVLSSYLVQIVNIVLKLFLIPIYVSALGISAYGIIGFYYSIESIMVLLDFGLGLASSQILASKFQSDPYSTLKTIRRTELIYLIISFFIGLLVFLFSGIISERWLHIDDVSLNGRNVVLYMAVLLTVGWPKSLYENILIGRNKIFQKNKINITSIIIRTLIMILFVKILGKGLDSYFLIMIFTTLVETLILRISAFSKLGIYTGFANNKEFYPFLKYASGVSLFSILSLFIFQSDKLFISKYLTTSDLGSYNLSGVIAFSMFSIVYPITSAAFPKLVNISSSFESEKIYKNWSRLLGVFTSAFFIFVIINYPILFNIWLKSKAVNVNIDVAKLLLLGVYLHTFTNFNVNLLLANGKSKHVSYAYLFTTISFIIFLFLYGKNSIENISLSWVFCNICLLFTLSISLFINYKDIFNFFIKDLLFFILIVAFFYFGNAYLLESLMVSTGVKILISTSSLLMFGFFLHIMKFFNIKLII
jgi:O-antigen/teichoic acid export membrane protein